MTSRGSLAYYLAAWVCGCFFMAFGFWVQLHLFRNSSSQQAFQDLSFLGFCFFGLIFGAVPSLLFAWLLRRSMKFFPTARIWLWVVAGSVLALLVIWFFGSIGKIARDPRYLPYSALPIWPFLLVGPLAILEGSFWMAIPAGGATAGVLYAVHRAFTAEVAAESTPQA